MASNAVPKTIVIKGEPREIERIAGGAITPGHLVTLNSSNKAIVHATATGPAAPMFARELTEIGKSIDDAYASNDNVPIHQAHSGDVIYGLVAAGAAAIVIGDLLESAGDGTVKKTTHATDTAAHAAATVIAQALEAVDNSGGGSAVRLKFQVV